MRYQRLVRQLYNEARQLASDPEELNLTFPSTIEVRKGDNSLEKHLYIDEKGLFLTTVNKWEAKVLTRGTR